MQAQIITRWIAPVLLAILAAPSFAVDGHEPPANPYLADSPWPMSHRTPYAQGSSPLPGPITSEPLTGRDYVTTGITNITLAASPAYPRPRQGRLIERLFGDYLDRQWGKPRVHWGSTFGAVYKLRDNQIVHRLEKPSGVNIGNFANATSGAYTLVDRDNTFFTVDGITVLAYRDQYPGDINSQIYLRSSFELPASSLRGDASSDPIVGMSLLWDGRIALATKLGTVIVLNRDFSQHWSIKLGDKQDPAGEEVSNSIAADEKNGIYVVTEKAMYRVQWTGFALSLAEHEGGWRAEYEAGEGQAPGRLGKGSGATPSLMGGPADKDRFVVITDGQDLAHLVLFWRDEIPNHWEQIPGTKSRRIAAQVPITFGDSQRQQTVSEQSVLVRGYGAVVVSNDYRNTLQASPESTPLIYNFLNSNPALISLQNGVVITLSQLPMVQPWGVHKFEWVPGAGVRGQGELRTAWVNRDVSCPNGIPTMSASSNMFYCIGAMFGAWTLEGLDWGSGDRKFSKFIGFSPIYNSFYASTQIDSNGRIISGTTLGVMQLDSN
ncbi:MAG: hypothetical protein ACK4SX_04955 [Alcanivoracaceae bacterium]